MAAKPSNKPGTKSETASQFFAALTTLAAKLPFGKLTGRQVFASFLGLCAVFVCVGYFVMTRDAQLGLIALFMILAFFGYLHRATELGYRRPDESASGRLDAIAPVHKALEEDPNQMPPAVVNLLSDHRRLECDPPAANGNRDLDTA
jgi:hypothetical protein